MSKLRVQWTVLITATLILACNQRGKEPDWLSPAGAAEWITSYYRAIDERRYETAYQHWEEQGGASGKTFAQFRDVYANTSRVEANVGRPGPMGAAAGSRYVEVPIRVVALMRDGSREIYEGSYTLRRAVVDGATIEQQAWHIYSARLRRMK